MSFVIAGATAATIASAHWRHFRWLPARLPNACTAQMGVDLVSLPLNSAHHRSLMAQGRMDYDGCVWSTSDLAPKENGGMGLAEVGAVVCSRAAVRWQGLGWVPARPGRFRRWAAMRNWLAPMSSARLTGNLRVRR